MKNRILARIEHKHLREVQRKNVVNNVDMVRFKGTMTKTNT